VALCLANVALRVGEFGCLTVSHAVCDDAVVGGHEDQGGNVAERACSVDGVQKSSVGGGKIPAEHDSKLEGAGWQAGDGICGEH